MEFLFNSNGVNNEIDGKEIESLDPFYQDYLLVNEAIGAEVFQFTLNGLSNLQVEGLFIQTNKFESSFTFATKIIFAKVNGTSGYKLKWNLGIFKFDAQGELFCDICKFSLNFLLFYLSLKTFKLQLS